MIQECGATHTRKTRAGVCLPGVSQPLRTLVSLSSPEGLSSGRERRQEEWVSENLLIGRSGTKERKGKKNQDLALVWVLLGKESCREARQRDRAWCVGGCRGMSILRVKLHVPFCTKVKFPGRPQRPELHTVAIWERISAWEREQKKLSALSVLSPPP